MYDVTKLKRNRLNVPVSWAFDSWNEKKILTKSTSDLQTKHKSTTVNHFRKAILFIIILCQMPLRMVRLGREGLPSELLGKLPWFVRLDEVPGGRVLRKAQPDGRLGIDCILQAHCCL